MLLSVLRQRLSLDAPRASSVYGTASAPPGAVYVSARMLIVQMGNYVSRPADNEIDIEKEVLL